MNASDRFNAYCDDLAKCASREVVDLYYSNHVRGPFVFEGREREGAEFKRHLATRLAETFSMRVDLGHIEICGSGHLGFSPVPEQGRFGRPFTPGESDLDVAIVSVGLFTRCWESVQEQPPSMRQLH